MKFRHPLLLILLSVIASSPAFADSSSPAALAPPLLYTQALPDKQAPPGFAACNRDCSVTYTDCRVNIKPIENPQLHNETCQDNYCTCMKSKCNAKLPSCP
jgi:hypothetical protein